MMLSEFQREIFGLIIGGVIGTGVGIGLSYIELRLWIRYSRRDNYMHNGFYLAIKHIVGRIKVKDVDWIGWDVGTAGVCDGGGGWSKQWNIPWWFDVSVLVERSCVAGGVWVEVAWARECKDDWGEDDGGDSKRDGAKEYAIIFETKPDPTPSPSPTGERRWRGESG
jgi:hypothetical protein